MDYQIIATLGPASDAAARWQDMASVGASAFRLNTSHLSIEELQHWLERLSGFFSRRGETLPVILDLQGSKWRLGQFPAFELLPGQTVRLVHAAFAQEALTLPVPHQDFFKASGQSGGEIVLNDAKSRLTVERADAHEIRARVQVGGSISAKKGVTFTDCRYRVESLSEKDRQITALTSGFAWVQFALSYVRDAEEMARYRAGFPPDVKLVAKLERREAMQEARAIAACVDAVWLCRGDLGAEMGLRGMAEAAHRFASALRELPVPAYLAGQVLEHLTEHAAPTRAEVSGLYAALQAGYAGVVLSDETAIGTNPVEACHIAAMFRE